MKTLIAIAALFISFPCLATKGIVEISGVNMKITLLADEHEPSKNFIMYNCADSLNVVPIENGVKIYAKSGKPQSTKYNRTSIRIESKNNGTTISIPYNSEPSARDAIFTIPHNLDIWIEDNNVVIITIPQEPFPLLL